MHELPLASLGDHKNYILFLKYEYQYFGDFIYPKKVLVTFVTDLILNNYVKSRRYLFVANKK